MTSPSSPPLSLSELARLDEKRKSEGPWEWDGRRVDSDGYVHVPQGSTLGETLITLGDVYEGSADDCDLIAYLLSHLPEIRERLEAYEALREAVVGYLRTRPLHDGDCMCAGCVLALTECGELPLRRRAGGE